MLRAEITVSGAVTSRQLQRRQAFTTQTVSNPVLELQVYAGTRRPVVRVCLHIDRVATRADRAAAFDRVCIPSARSASWRCRQGAPVDLR
jgi:hypothetical protein